jgi:glycosyltransferase involved in cell wall biosynthesis
MAGQRSRLDAVAPTRMMKGYDRMPEVYGSAAQAAVSANSISIFHFDRLYFCSRALKEATELAGFCVSHGEVFYPGIPTQYFVGEIKPSAAAVRKLLVVGRLNEQSGVLTALQALQRIRENDRHTTLSIYGRGESDYVSHVRSFVVRGSLPVEFLPVANQPRELAAIYRQHDALLYTTEWDEPFATTPLEAMACGLPVIGSNIGGAQELFRHGENALTYTAGDVTELTARILELQTQPTLRCHLAETAQSEVLSRYNETAYVDQIENYLNASIEVWQQT